MGTTTSAKIVKCNQKQQSFFQRQSFEYKPTNKQQSLSKTEGIERFNAPVILPTLKVIFFLQKSTDPCV